MTGQKKLFGGCNQATFKYFKSLNAFISYYYLYLYMTSPFKLFTVMKVAHSVTCYLNIFPTTSLIYMIHSNLTFFFELLKLYVFSGLTPETGNEEGWRREWWFSAQESLLLLRTWVLSPATMHWLPVTLTPWIHFTLLAIEGTCTHVTDTQTHNHTWEYKKLWANYGTSLIFYS